MNRCEGRPGVMKLTSTASLFLRLSGPPRVRGGSRSPLRLLAGSVAVLLGVSPGCSAASNHPRPAAHRVTAVEIGNLRMSVPPLWSVRRLEDRCFRLGAGVLVSNLDPAALGALRRDLHGLPRGSCTDAWDVTVLPPKFVMLDVSQFSPPVKVPETQFPLSESFFAPSALDCRCSFRFNFISYGGESYKVRIWVGNRASELDRRDITCLVASVRPKTSAEPRLQDCVSRGKS
jgi:hypothetical protein